MQEDGLPSFPKSLRWFAKTPVVRKSGHRSAGWGRDVVAKDGAGGQHANQEARAPPTAGT